MGRLLDAICVTPPVFNQDKADADLADFNKLVAGPPELTTAGSVLHENPLAINLLKSIFGASPYLTGLILREPETVLAMLNNDVERQLSQFEGELTAALAGAESMNEAMAGLRRYKRQIALFVALVDIGGIWNIHETTKALSNGASFALNCAVRYLLRQAAGRGDFLADGSEAIEANSGYIVLGLGKLGALELNYSSDIDVIVFFEPSRAPLREGVEPQQFFVALTKDLVKLMQERTAEGYVFRTDLRLRPDPGATQVALSTEAGLIYYESFGQNWERAAMIKARPVAGDIAAGEEFLAALSPFVWRKYLDYAAIADVHAMKRQIHAVKGHGEIAVKGHNIKLGRGGIREIEFFAQTQQLIAGGRQPGLRCRRTMEALNELVANEWIEASTAEELATAYAFLRKIEHRVQMIADEQTHSLPSDDEELLRVANFSGFDDIESFSQALRLQLETVQEHYGALFEDVPGLTADSGNLVFTGDDPDPGTVETLAAMGFSSPGQVIETVKNWHFGRYPATRSEKARERLTEVQPLLLAALADTAQPQTAFTVFDRFLADLPAGIQLFSLLRNNPPLLRLLAGIMGTAPRLATILSRRANLLDAVLDPGFFGDLPSDQALKSIVDEAIDGCEHYQDCLDMARDIGQEQTFLIGVRVLSGTVSAEQAGGAFAHLAEHLIGALYDKVLQEMSRSHGRVQNSSAAVIAMGKLGGEEMTAASDLDLIVVYDVDSSSTESDGERPLSASQYFARLTQRLISALTAPTASGRLYEVDMRLRPSGNAGPVATAFESFTDYHHNKAWTWEHMALTRARVVAGPPALSGRVNELIAELLCKKRDQQTLIDDISEMRERISAAKGDEGIWNLKLVRGGLIDLEFLAQYLQLLHAHEKKDVLRRNTYEAFVQLEKFGYLDPEKAALLLDATRLYHNLTQILRLCYEGEFEADLAPHGLKVLLAQVAGEPDFERLEARLNETQKSVGALFDTVFKRKGS